MITTTEDGEAVAVAVVDRGTGSGLSAPSARRLMLWLGLLLVAFGATTFASSGGIRQIQGEKTLDLNINMVAANRLVHRKPLYDLDASRKDAVALAGPSMAGAYRVPTNSFPGPPSTALVHVPFLVFGHETGATVFRWAAALGMFAAIALVAASLPVGSRLPAGLVGTGTLLISYAFTTTLLWGQGHEFLMLGFAAGVWGIRHERWKVAGIGLGIAAVLKLSPVLLLAYLVLRGRREVVKSAVATIVAFTVAAAVVGRPQDLIVWIRDVVPGISGAALHVVNQSLPATLDRMFGGHPDLGATLPIGAWHDLAIPIVVGGVFALWRLRRNAPLDPLELGALIVLVLLAGPLSWDHYATWVTLTVVLLADPRRWEGRSRVEVGVLLASLLGAAALLSPRLVAPSATKVALHWSLRVTSSPYVGAELLLGGICLWLLRPGARTGPNDPAVGRTTQEERQVSPR